MQAYRKFLKVVVESGNVYAQCLAFNSIAISYHYRGNLLEALNYHARHAKVAADPRVRCTAAFAVSVDVTVAVAVAVSVTVAIAAIAATVAVTVCILTVTWQPRFAEPNCGAVQRGADATQARQVRRRAGVRPLGVRHCC
jgi:hypothetical protein